MQEAIAPIAALVTKPKTGDLHESELIYGGYSNARGEIALFAERLVLRVNLKNKTVRQQPGLNSEAQQRYDAVEAGETFQYCSANFRRLSKPQILEICASGPFRVTPRAV